MNSMGQDTDATNTSIHGKGTRRLQQLTIGHAEMNAALPEELKPHTDATSAKKKNVTTPWSLQP